MSVAPPNTVVQLSHAVTLTVGGKTIGAISQWSPKETRAITELYELNASDQRTAGGAGPGSPTVYSQLSGEPFEKVPGNVSGMQIDVQRYDVYTMQMEQAFTTGVGGTFGLDMLSKQQNAFEVRETWTTPNNERNYFTLYRGCWFSNIGRTIQATSDRIVNVNATLEYTRKDTLPI